MNLSRSIFAAVETAEPTLAMVREPECAKRGAEIPFPNDQLFVRDDIHGWRVTDEQAICAGWIDKDTEVFTLNRRLLTRPDIPPSLVARFPARRAGLHVS
jgi:hypothetical protein